MPVSIGMVTGRKYVYPESATPLNQRQIKDMANMGCRTIRMEFEDAQGAKADHVQAYRNILQWAGDAGLKVIGLLTQSSMPDPNYSPGSTRDKADFEANFLPKYLDSVRWHERTYGGYPSLEGWEIFNEPDVPSHGWYRPTPSGPVFMADEVALTQVRVWEWIKVPGQLQPSRRVIMAAMSHTDTLRWKEVFNTDTMFYFRQANGGRIPADVVGIHGYGQRWDPRASDYSIYGGNFEAQLNRFFGYRDRTDAPLVPANIPLYMTELGIDSKQQPNAAEVAAGMRYYYATLEKFSSRITKAFWYTYRDDEEYSAASGFKLGPTAYGIRKIARVGQNPTSDQGGIKVEPYNMLRNIAGSAGVGQAALFGTAKPTFVDAFTRADMAQNMLGYPADNGGTPFVHQWGNASVQDFKGAQFSATGQAMITQEDNVGVAAVVYGRFWDTWLANGGGPGVGFPFNNGGGVDRHAWNSGADTGFVQDLRKAGRHNAMLMYETGAGRIDRVFIVREPILPLYMAGGGVARYGYARGDRVWDGSRWTQVFAHGTITAP